MFSLDFKHGKQTMMRVISMWTHSSQLNWRPLNKNTILYTFNLQEIKNWRILIEINSIFDPSEVTSCKSSKKCFSARFISALMIKPMVGCKGHVKRIDSFENILHPPIEYIIQIIMHITGSQVWWIVEILEDKCKNHNSSW